MDTDVLIVGGGLAGCTLAALVGGAGVSVTLVDREVPAQAAAPDADGRTTALALGPRRVVEAAGVWADLAPHACPIRKIRTADEGSSLFLDFDAAELGDAPFGHIVENHRLRAALHARLAALPTVRHLAPATVTSFARTPGRVAVTLADGRTVAAPLLVGADGRGSPTRAFAGIETFGWAYRQTALVFVATHERPHDHAAIELFRPTGPFAVLPMLDDEAGRPRSSFVWSEDAARVPSYLALPPDSFSLAVQRRLGEGLGRVRLHGRRWTYPLSLMHAKSYVGDRIALVAEAAHAIHPIAGQGLNLGLRDVAQLAERIVDQARLGLDPGDPGLLADYQRARRFDNLALVAFTDLLNRLFANRVAPVRLARDLGLGLFNRIGPLRRGAMRQAMGVAGSQGRILAGAAL